MELATETAAPARGTKWWQQNNREARLKRDVAEGRSYTAIADELGISVGAVCGKISRLGCGRGQPPQPLFWHGRQSAGPFGPPDGMLDSILKRQEEEASRRGGATLAHHKIEDHHCRFVIGNPVKGRVCGATRVDDKPYCPEHARRCLSTRDLEWREQQASATLSHPRGSMLKRTFIRKNQQFWNVNVHSLEFEDAPA